MMSRQVISSIILFTAFMFIQNDSMRAGYSKHLSRILRRELNKLHVIPEIRLLKRRKTATLSRVSRKALGSDLRRDSDSLTSIVGVQDFMYVMRFIQFAPQ